MKVLALALDDKVLALAPQVLALALKQKSWPSQTQGRDFPPPRPKARGCCVYALLTLLVSHDSLPFLV